MKVTLYNDQHNLPSFLQFLCPAPCGVFFYRKFGALTKLVGRHFGTQHLTCEETSAVFFTGRTAGDEDGCQVFFAGMTESCVRCILPMPEGFRALYRVALNSTGQPGIKFARFHALLLRAHGSKIVEAHSGADNQYTFLAKKVQRLADVHVKLGVEVLTKRKRERRDVCTRQGNL